MRRKLTAWVTACALILMMLPVGAVQQAAVSVTIDGVAVTYTADSGAPFIDANNRTQVPFRQTMETFGCAVEWRADTRTAVAIKNGITVEVPIGQACIYKNGTKIENDTAALIAQDRTYLPIRVVLEAFGCTVGWQAESRTVVASTGTAATGAAELKIYFIDVGQADAALIDYGTYEVLIDGGNNKDGTTVSNFIRPYVDGDLDLMIATHPDADHIGGLDTVLADYHVNEIIDSGDQSKTTKTYTDYRNAAENEPNCTLLEDADMVIDMGGAKLQIIETGDGYKDSNDNSVVAMLRYGSVSVLFTGDMESAAETASLSKFTDVDVLKVGHHGSRTSSSAAFLSIVKPEYAVISAGVGNSYHHPHAEVLQRLLDAGTIIYGTFKSGTITMTTDGTTYSFDTTQALTLQDAAA